MMLKPLESGKILGVDTGVDVMRQCPLPGCADDLTEPLAHHS